LRWGTKSGLKVRARLRLRLRLRVGVGVGVRGRPVSEVGRCTLLTVLGSIRGDTIRRIMLARPPAGYRYTAASRSG
jgi:hypothetical protein